MTEVTASDPHHSRATGSEQEQLATFRHVRELIAASIARFLEHTPWRSLEDLYAAASAEEQPR